MLQYRLSDYTGELTLQDMQDYTGEYSIARRSDYHFAASRSSGFDYGGFYPLRDLVLLPLRAFLSNSQLHHFNDFTAFFVVFRFLNSTFLYPSTYLVQGLFPLYPLILPNTKIFTTKVNSSNTFHFVLTVALFLKSHTFRLPQLQLKRMGFQEEEHRSTNRKMLLKSLNSAYAALPLYELPKSDLLYTSNLPFQRLSASPSLPLKLSLIILDMGLCHFSQHWVM